MFIWDLNMGLYETHCYQHSVCDYFITVISEKTVFLYSSSFSFWAFTRITFICLFKVHSKVDFSSLYLKTLPASIHHPVPKPLPHFQLLVTAKPTSSSNYCLAFSGGCNTNTSRWMTCKTQRFISHRSGKSKMKMLAHLDSMSG